MSLNINDLTKLLKKKQSKYAATKPFPKQLAFSLITKKEALFGGSLGGGKSEAVLQIALSYVHIPGFSCLILRKTLADLKLKGALLQRMGEWMAPFLLTKEVKYVASEHKYVFKTYHPVTGERCADSFIQFGYIGESNAHTRYQGAEFSLCVEGDTKVSMADGSTLPIKDIVVGDLVETLNGPRRVSRTHRVKKKSCALLTPTGCQIQGITHKTLSSPSQTDVDISKKFSSHDKLFLQTSETFDKSSTHHEDSHQGLSQTHESEQLFPYPFLTATDECTLYTNLDNGFVKSVHEPPASQQLDLHSASLEEQVQPQTSEWASFHSRRGNVHALSELQDIDCQEDYLACLRQYDEFQKHSELDLPKLLPSQECVTLSTFCVSDNTPQHNHLQSVEVFHPYTCDEIGLHQLRAVSSLLIPLNVELNLCDITVEGESHYITVPDSVNRCVNSNCIFDEVTQHTEADYTYLFTRLRKCVCPTHQAKDKDGHPVYYRGCQECDWAQEIPTMMRATCNPDGLGFAWVKKRFKISPNMTEDEAADRGERVKWIGKDPNRPFLPSTFLDNPHLNHAEYGQQLKNTLTDEMYEALVLGSWGVVPNARFKKKWKKTYSQYHNLMYLGRNRHGEIIDSKQDYQKVFLTVDTATTAMEGPGDTEMFPTVVKNPSWTVICSWALTGCYKLLWLEMMRFREEIPEVVEELKLMYERWNPTEAVVEENGVGKGVSQFASRMGMNIIGLHKSKDKVENATEAILQMKKGRIWLPEYADWLEDAESELFTWQGHPKETDDIIDNVAHACNHVDWTKAPDHHRTSSIQPQAVTAERLPGAYRPKFMFRP